MELVPVVPEKVPDSAGRNTRISPAKHWCFTLNNPEEADIAYWRDRETDGSIKWVVQLEVGESGTPHLQGYVGFSVKVRPLSVINNPRYHWSVCKKVNASILYCQKMAGRIDGPWKKGFPKPPNFILDVLRDWQLRVDLIVSLPADNRTVNWVVDPAGRAGKTAFCKHLCTLYPEEVIYICGKAADCKYAISEWLGANKKLRIVLFDFTRSLENFVSYEAIESIKNGIFFSTKYESKMAIFESPHVVCFSNFEPDRSKLSADRWNIIHVDDFAVRHAPVLDGGLGPIPEGPLDLRL